MYKNKKIYRIFLLTEGQHVDEVCLVEP